MGGFSFKRVDLANFTGVSREVSEGYAEPASVTAGGALRFIAATHKVHCLLFELNQAVEPNWFGVAIPADVTDLTSVLLFFHPMPGQPGQVGYDDRQYAAKAAKWSSSLPRYIGRLGFQVAASGKNRVMIMPFLPKRVNNDLGIFAANWKEIVAGLLVQAQREIRPHDDIAPIMFNLSLASFSVGIKYLHTFMTKAKDYRPYLREVYDFDGSFSSDSGTLAPVVRTLSAGVRHVMYDQLGGGVAAQATAAASGLIHVPADRWAARPDMQQDVHNHMVFLLAHALASSPRP